MALLLLVRQVLLHHPADLAISIEMLANHALFIKRSANLLRRAANGSLIYTHTQNRQRLMLTGNKAEEGRLTGEHGSDSAVLGKDACPGSLGLVAGTG